MKTINFVFLTIFVLLICSTKYVNFGSKKINFPEKMETLNVIVLLDLSDRIIKTTGQASKDQKILQELLTLFEERQRRQIYIGSNDCLRVLVAAQPGVDEASNDDLVIDMNKLNSRKNGQPMGKAAFDAARKKFNSALAALYNKALKSPHTGADIYTFFCSDYPANNMNTDLKIKNKIIILSDGYLTFDAKYLPQRPQCSYMRNLEQLRAAKDQWQAYFKKNNLALCPCSRKFKNTEVMLLETAPLNKATSVNEFPIVKYYWQEWFNKMSVPTYIYRHEGQVTSISDKIKSFLN